MGLVASDEIKPIGFPIADVFAFDPELMAQLKAEWDNGHQPRLVGVRLEHYLRPGG